MDRIDEQAAKLLAPLRDAEPDAPSGVDIGGAVRAGRRHSRRRVVAGVAAAASVTALSLVAVPAVLNPLTSVPPAASAPTFSLARQVITVGTAGGYTPASYRTGRFEQVAELRRTDNGNGYGRVTAYAPGRNPTIDTTEPAADVNGLPAFWQPGLPEPTLAVRGGDVWVIVRSSGDFPDIVDRTHHIAQSLRFGADVPVTVPFTVNSALPLRPVGVLVRTDSSAAQLLLGDSDATGAEVLTIAVSLDGTGFASPNDLVDGREAVVDEKSVTVALDADGRGGEDSAVSVRYDNPDRVGGIETLKRLAGSVRPVPNLELDDRSTWVPSPWQ